MLCRRSHLLPRALPRPSLPALPRPLTQPLALRTLTISTLPRPALPRAALESNLTATSTAAGARPGVLAALGPLLLTRGAVRDTYDPSVRVRKRRHGFLARLRTRKGRNTLKRRRTKGRGSLSH